MLRLNPFQIKMPTSLDEACELLSQSDGKARILAGGTDLLPNLKHGIYGEVTTLISLNKISGLDFIQETGGNLTIGAGAKLSTLASNQQVYRHYPALALAAAHVASPQIRNMATLGGNLCLDTRCTYINQSEFWRQALGGCLKAIGEVCHVIPGGQKCVAGFSADMPIALIALEANAEIFTALGTKIFKLVDLYKADGVNHLNLRPGEILSQVHIPIKKGRRLAFRKWSVRQSIDFPLVNVAIRVDETESGEIADIVAVVGVLASRPRVFKNLVSFCRGKRMNETLASKIGEAIYEKCRPVANVPYDPDYRREMLRVQAKRAALCLVPGARLKIRDHY